ncbi:hypothetical protein RHGRI_005955 [Rhododendron griersonianum]|uniref:Uncharacterized protein n=1 Tax=Rhododendron griersonianum TaxID=479676 RepID=A0AAV6LEJ5_9ERIC|nr:hypothetical protein RHGRI_005955 [Rhododendron griersonianum]
MCCQIPCGDMMYEDEYASIVRGVESIVSPEEDEQQVRRVKDWINCCHLGTVELTDVLSNFPDVSLVLIEEIIDELVKEGTLSKAGTESYTIIKQKNCECELEAVKEEMEGHVVANGKNAQVDTGEDHMYMKTRKLLLFVACFFLALAPSLVEKQVGQFALVLQWIPSKCHHEPGIVAGSSYAPVDIVSRVVRKSILGVLVIVRCGTSGGKSITREIDICAVQHCYLHLLKLRLFPLSPPALPPSTPITAAIIPIVAPQFPQPQPLPPTLPSPTPLTFPPSSTPPLKSPSPPASPPLKSPSPSASPSHSSPPLMSFPPRPSPSPTQFSFRIVIRISVTLISSFVGTIFLVIYPIITFWQSGREQEKKKKKKKKKR